MKYLFLFVIIIFTACHETEQPIDVVEVKEKELRRVEYPFEKPLNVAPHETQAFIAHDTIFFGDDRHHHDEELGYEIYGITEDSVKILVKVGQRDRWDYELLNIE